MSIDDENSTGIPVLRTINFTNEGIINYKDVITRMVHKKYKRQIFKERRYHN